MSIIEATNTSTTGTAAPPAPEKPRLSFLPEHGLWEVAAGPHHFYCASLISAMGRLARTGPEISSLDQLDIRTGDHNVDRELAALADLTNSPGSSSAADALSLRRRRVLRTIDDVGLNIGAADLELLLTCASSDLVSLRLANDTERELDVRAIRSTGSLLGATNWLVHAHKVTGTPPVADEHSATTPHVLVVPVTSPGAMRKTRTVVSWLAARLDCQVEYVYVSAPDATSGEDVADFATNVLAQVAVGIDARARVLVTDDVAATVVDVCRDRLTCMETHASAFRHGTFVDSFAAAILATSNAPVVLVGPSFDGSAPLDCTGLSIAVAGEDHESGLVDAAMVWASALHLPAGVIHVDQPGDGPVGNQNSERERSLWNPLAVTRVDAPTDALATAILDRAGDSWVGVGTHARRGLDRIAEGSIAFDIVALATTPVIAFGPCVDGSLRVIEAEQAMTPVDSVESLVSLVTNSAHRSETVDAVMVPRPGWMASLDLPWG